MSSPIDRYSIITSLGEGGMAEVFLARLNGPEGFERVVVLKVVQSDLADDPDLVNMFLDEARLIAKIRHPNVVQVSDLGRGPQGPYLAMEYLHGENAQTVLGSLGRRKLRLDPALACYIASEAAAGLHAAHELTDKTGQRERVVHRDISPDNLFLTYDGDVKVIDFGVAKSRLSAARTEAGMVKGKAAYMSPEQILARGVDRRTDVFALGIVLWELLTGRRLFRRDTMEATWNAVLNDPVPSVRELSATCSEELAAICKRALQRDLSLRYQTADAMRKELVGCMLREKLSQMPRDSLGELMRSVFVTEREEKENLLNSASVRIAVREILPSPSRATGLLTGTHSVLAPPVPAPPVPAPKPIAQPLPPTMPFATSAPATQEISDIDEPIVGRTWMYVALWGGVMAALVFGLWLGTRKRVAPPAPTVTSIEAPVGPTTSTSTSLSAEKVKIHIESQPSGATVYITDRKEGTTPLDLEIGKGDAPLSVELRLNGYQPLQKELPHNRDQNLEWPLVKSATKHHADTTKQPEDTTPHYRRFD